MSITYTSDGLPSEFYINKGYFTQSTRDITITDAIPIGGCVHFHFKNTYNGLNRAIFQTGIWEIIYVSFSSTSYYASGVSEDVPVIANLGSTFYIVGQYDTVDWDEDDEPINERQPCVFANVYAWRVE